MSAELGVPPVNTSITGTAFAYKLARRMIKPFCWCLQASARPMPMMQRQQPGKRRPPSRLPYMASAVYSMLQSTHIHDALHQHYAN
jgi:hypothetical protein